MNLVQIVIEFYILLALCVTTKSIVLNRINFFVVMNVGTVSCFCDTAGHLCSGNQLMILVIFSVKLFSLQ